MATFTAINCKHQSGGAMRGTLDYVSQEKKTRWGDAKLVTGHNCVPQSAYTEMLTTKQRFGKKDIRRVTHSARTQERQFAQYINQKNSVELRREMNALQKELDTMRKRNSELSLLFKRLYEDHVLGRVTAEQFRMLSGDYNAEQKQLEDAIPEKEARLEKLKASAANVDTFIEKAKRYTAINELTPELLRLFVQRIEVGERSKKYSRSAAQSVRIIYRDIGSMDRPMEPKVLQPHDTPEVGNLIQIPA